MLGRQHPSGEARLVVAGQNRYGGLADQRPLIDAVDHPVNAAAMLAHACGEGLAMGVQAGESRKQGRVDIDHPTRPRSDEIGCQHPHVASKSYELDVRRFQDGVDRALMGRPVPRRTAYDRSPGPSRRCLPPRLCRGRRRPGDWSLPARFRQG